MNHPHPPPLPHEQPPHWHSGDQRPPPQRQSLVGAVLLTAGIAVIIFLVIAIVVVLVRGSGPDSRAGSESTAPAGSPSPFTPTPEETTVARPPDQTPTRPTIEVPTADPDLTTGVFPERMDGYWSGTMTQYDSDGAEIATWDLELHMIAEQSIGGADLTLSDGTTCTWNILAVANTEDTVDIDYYTNDNGGGKCTDSGFVHIIMQNGRLSVGVASVMANGQTTTAAGTLT